MSLPKQKLMAIAKGVKAMVLDVDGVLTDTGLIYGPRGEALKVFSARDGFAVKLAQSQGIPVAILSGRLAPPVKARLADLGIPPELVIQGSRDKKKDLATLAGRLRLGLAEIAYMGDDVPDLPALAIAGLAVCPADASDEAKERAHCVTESPGGRGAVRDLVRLLLRARGRWEKIMEDWAAGIAAGPFFRKTGRGASDGQ